MLYVVLTNTLLYILTVIRRVIITTITIIVIKNDFIRRDKKVFQQGQLGTIAIYYFSKRKPMDVTSYVDRSGGIKLIY